MIRVNRTPQDVVEILDALIRRDLSDVDWDDFISVKIKDRFLESVRQEMEELWQENSPYLESGAIDPNLLSHIGRDKVRNLSQRCEDYARKNFTA